MIGAAVALVELAYAVPEVGRGVLRVIEGVLVRLVRLGQVIGHEVAMGEHAPGLAAGGVGGNGALEIGEGLRVALLLGEYEPYLSHCVDVAWVDE